MLKSMNYRKSTSESYISTEVNSLLLSDVVYENKNMMIGDHKAAPLVVYISRIIAAKKNALLWFIHATTSRWFQKPN